MSPGQGPSENRTPENGRPDRFDVLVVGGGHAGIEAAWSAANAGVRVAIVTLDASKIGVMSCNPAIGGLAKGQMVREIDALGGLMGRITDATGIMFKALNTSKGAAVRGPRAQCDKHAYAEEAQRLIRARPEIAVIEGGVERLLFEDGALAGAIVRERRVGEQVAVRARAVVLTTGTFMRGLMHTGEDRTPGGRVGEAPATGISASLRELGFEMGRLKTGTPPRLRRSTIDWDALEPQRGDERPAPFSDMTEPSRFPLIGQVECRITRTNERVHGAIRANLHRAPMFSGQIESRGPRYCPSIEDKVVRFADKDSHQVFLEPESHRDDSIYCNGIATSLPRDVQETIVRGMAGCERAEILLHGYAVEYDMVPPHQIDATTMTKRIEGLFLAGQINGTSGYEEAGAQGVIAGVNAARFALGECLVTLGRDQAYIGVLLDDLVTKTPTEPYRMFTSRAEHRLLLRADNAPDRLTPLAREWGICDDARWSRFESRREERAALEETIQRAHLEGVPLARVCKRQEFGVDDLRGVLARLAPRVWSEETLVSALTDQKYEGYLRRQRAEIKRQESMERRRIPEHVAYESVDGLRNEARQALARFRPSTFGQAGRLEGVTPADLTLLLIASRRR
ncbi:MAG: tRNA uridine-5-carboxymethylaminomethyl(34) synthesis enzyme MnmG [Phycisphaeraceae bacterium]|nr:tRNA uridine-5-carboxymethylaminomethyl(34) synthesis enzyme MnmG [Phycisphaeraceae bacterium]